MGHCQASSQHGENIWLTEMKARLVRFKEGFHGVPFLGKRQISPQTI